MASMRIALLLSDPLDAAGVCLVLAVVVDPDQDDFPDKVIENLLIVPVLDLGDGSFPALVPLQLHHDSWVRRPAPREERDVSHAVSRW